MKLIINADDFGYSSSINETTVNAMKNGLISSTSLLVNMSGFEEAVELSKSKEFIGRVGIHLNLFEGEPLTKEIQKHSLFCDANGHFHGKKIQFHAPLFVNSKIIYNELNAQIEKALNAGIRPTHLDSHANRHANYFIGNIVIKLAKKFDIQSIRINDNVFQRKNLLSKLMVKFYNFRLKVYGIKCADYLGTIPEVAAALPKLSGIVEVIAHPINKNGAVSDLEYEGDLSELLSPFQKIEKISYGQL